MTNYTNHFNQIKKGEGTTLSVPHKMTKQEAINRVNEGVGSIYTKEDVTNLINQRQRLRQLTSHKDCVVTSSDTSVRSGKIKVQR